MPVLSGFLPLWVRKIPFVPHIPMTYICRQVSRGNLVGRRAFSLIELLTVVAIIGILAAIVLPVVSSVRKNVDVATCASRLRDIFKGYKMYAAENNDRIILSFRFKDATDNASNYSGISPDYKQHWWFILLKYGYLGAPDIPNIYYTPLLQSASGAKWSDSKIRYYYKTLGCPTVQAYGLDHQADVDEGSGQRIPTGSGYMNYGMNSEIANPNNLGVSGGGGLSALNMTFDQIAKPSCAILGGDYKLDRMDSTIINISSGAYFPQAIHGNCANILFCDGHVECLDVDKEIPKADGDKIKYSIWWKGKNVD